MRCDQAREQMLAHLGGQLPESAAADLEQHVEDCAPCRERWAEERSLAERLTAPAGLAGDVFADAIMARVRGMALRPQASKADEPVVRLHHTPRPLLAVLTAAAAGVVWLVFGPSGEPLAATELAAALTREAALQLADLGALLGSLAELVDQAYRTSLALPAGLDPVVSTPWLYLATAAAGLFCGIAIARFRSTASEEIRP